MFVAGVGNYGGAQGHAVDQRVQRKPECQAHPTERVLPRGVTMVLVMMLARPFMRMLVIGDEVAHVAMLMSMYMEHADHEKHCQEACESPAGNAIDRA